MDVVQIACGLEWSISQTAERAERIHIATLFDIPSWRFGTEIDTNKKGDCRDECGAQLQSPRDVARVVNSQIGAETQENAESRPHLPAHDEASTNGGWAILGRENWNSRSLGAHSYTEQQTGDEQLLPVLRHGRANHREEAEYGGEEDCATTAKVVVEWVREPAATVKRLTTAIRQQVARSLQSSGANVRTGVDNTHNPTVISV